MRDRKNGNAIEILKEGLWEERYALAIHWKSDLEFYKDDLRFLHHLIDKYFIWISKSENITRVREINFGLLKLTVQVKDLAAKVNQHLIQLGGLVKHPDHAKASKVESTHALLEEEFAEFVKAFRKNRKETFKITEYIIDSEELTQYLRS